MYHYRLGLARDKKGDPDGAMAAYSSTISLDNAPDDVKAMALYNRALLFATRGDHGKAAADLNAIMVMPTPVRGVTDCGKTSFGTLATPTGRNRQCAIGHKSTS